MRLVSKLAFAVVGLGLFSTAASAAVTLSSAAGLSTHPGVGPGEQMIWNFDTGIGGIENSHFQYHGDVFTSSLANVAADPAGDTSAFGAAENAAGAAAAGQAFTDAMFTVNTGTTITSLSIDLGSLDTFNTLNFYSGTTLEGHFTGNTLAAALLGLADGNQTSDLTNGRFYFKFLASDDINKLVFSSTSPAFEFDNIAATISGVPEPATWAMMLLGFGFVGFMMRSNRQKTATIAI